MRVVKKVTGRQIVPLQPTTAVAEVVRSHIKKSLEFATGMYTHVCFLVSFHRYLPGIAPDAVQRGTPSRGVKRHTTNAIPFPLHAVLFARAKVTWRRHAHRIRVKESIQTEDVVNYAGIQHILPETVD